MKTETAQVVPPNPPLHYVEDALVAAKTFNRYEGVNQGEYYLRQLIDFEETMAEVKGTLGVFATGHPFYAFMDGGGVHAIDEFDRFIDERKGKLEVDKLRKLGAWPCVSCQVKRNLTDLKSECTPCNDVTFKPRDLFRALPDLDFWVVAGERSEVIEAEVAAQARTAGFYPSDENILTALEVTKRVMSSITNGEIPKERLPIDLHMVTRQQLLEGLLAIQYELRNTANAPCVPCSPRSYYARWITADNPYNLMMDFVFSFTPAGWQDESLKQLLAETRHEVRVYAEQGGDMVELVSRMSPKEARILQTPAIQRELIKRVSSW